MVKSFTCFPWYCNLSFHSTSSSSKFSFSPRIFVSLPPPPFLPLNLFHFLTFYLIRHMNVFSTYSLTFLLPSSFLLRSASSYPVTPSCRVAHPLFIHFATKTFTSYITFLPYLKIFRTFIDIFPLSLSPSLLSLPLHLRRYFYRIDAYFSLPPFLSILRSRVSHSLTNSPFLFLPPSLLDYGSISGLMNFYLNDVLFSPPLFFSLQLDHEHLC